MEDTQAISFDTLRLHYIFFNDNSHSMNASVQNKCEAEALKIIKEIASAFNLEIKIEVLPSEEGSFIKKLKVILGKDINSSLGGQLVIIAFSTLLGYGATQLGKNDKKEAKEIELLDLQIFNERADSLLKSMNIEEKQKQLDSLNAKVKFLSEKNTLKKKRSNFYSSLNTEPKVKKIGYSAMYGDTLVFDEILVEKSDFKKFILTSDDLEPIEDDNALIEIISPVLKNKSKAKWSGIYEGKEITFKMQSTEFLKLVQAGQIEFKNGFQINCELIISRKIDDEGHPTITGYSVETVTAYNISQTPVQTIEGKKGKRNKKNKNSDSDQLAMF